MSETTKKMEMEDIFVKAIIATKSSEKETKIERIYFIYLYLLF